LNLFSNANHFIGIKSIIVLNTLDYECQIQEKFFNQS